MDLHSPAGKAAMDLVLDLKHLVGRRLTGAIPDDQFRRERTALLGSLGELVQGPARGIPCGSREPLG